MGLYDFEEPETEIPAAFARRFGNARVPSSADVRAWRRGLLGARKVGQRFTIDGKPIVEPFVSRWDMRHPTTGRWTAPWRPMPTGKGMEANLRVRFKKGDPRASAAGKRGGRSRSKAKLAALVLNRAKAHEARRRKTQNSPGESSRAIPVSPSTTSRAVAQVSHGQKSDSGL